MSIALHDDGRHLDIGLDALVRQHTSAINIDLVTYRDIVSEDSDVLQSSPSTDTGAPANDSALDPGMVLDLAVFEKDASLQSHTITDDTARADDHVGADAAVLADLRCLMDHDVSAVNVPF